MYSNTTDILPLSFKIALNLSILFFFKSTASFLTIRLKNKKNCNINMNPTNNINMNAKPNNNRNTIIINTCH